MHSFSAPRLCISLSLNGVHDCTHFTCHMRRVEECAGRNTDKIVNRKLVQVYTPGTVLDGPMLVRDFVLCGPAAALVGAWSEVIRGDMGQRGTATAH